MNPLETNPNLFVTKEGKFKAVTGGLDPHTITGLKPSGENEIQLCLGYRFGDGVFYFVEPKHCTLIARPKEDMTDEEIKKYDQIKQKAFWEMGSGVTINEPGFYLLKIGVYPFSQQHFGDTVIDSRTLKTTA